MLLDDIIDLATDDKQSIAVLLRKCIILASQLKNERLKSWANKELNGYDPDDNLPPYRTLKTIAKGNFTGSFGRQLRGWQIPAAVLEEEHRRWATDVSLVHPIGAYEDLSKGDGSVESPWDPNLVLYYQQRIPLQGYYLISAWQEIPTSAIVGMLDTVRTSVLNMALEIKSEIGETDADLKKIAPQDAKKVDQTVTTYIYGGSVNISTGESAVNTATIQQQQNIVAGDWEHLAKVLRSSGVSEPELRELSKAVEEDGRTLGSKVKDWITKTAPKVLSGGVKIGATVGQTLLLEYLKQYYGLG
jgi:hypothetical protein